MKNKNAERILNIISIALTIPITFLFIIMMIAIFNSGFDEYLDGLFPTADAQVVAGVIGIITLGTSFLSLVLSSITSGTYKNILYIGSTIGLFRRGVAVFGSMEFMVFTFVFRVIFFIIPFIISIGIPLPFVLFSILKRKSDEKKAYDNLVSVASIFREELSDTELIEKS